LLGDIMIFKKFMTSLKIAKEQINDSLFMLTNRTKSTYFTKNPFKMNFKDALYFILKGLRKMLQIEIDDWFEFFGGENTMTKQAFSQLRQKLKPDAFIQLNEKYINWFYSDDDFNKYKGYRLTAALLKFQIQLTTENISDIIITKAIGSKQGRWYV